MYGSYPITGDGDNYLHIQPRGPTEECLVTGLALAMI